jgi:hypothetical protein
MKYAFAAAALIASVSATPAWAPPAGYSQGGAVTSTVEITTEVTVTSCAATVTNCPGNGGYPAGSAPGGGWGSPSSPASAPAVYSSAGAESVSYTNRSVFLWRKT